MKHWRCLWVKKKSYMAWMIVFNAFFLAILPEGRGSCGFQRDLCFTLVFVFHVFFMFLLPPVEIFFGKIGKIVRLNFYSLLCTDGKIILIILSSGNTRYLSYIGMNHDWWLIDHEWWFVVSDCDCDCPESDFEFWY